MLFDGKVAVRFASLFPGLNAQPVGNVLCPIIVHRTYVANSAKIQNRCKGPNRLAPYRRADQEMGQVSCAPARPDASNRDALGQDCQLVEHKRGAALISWRPSGRLRAHAGVKPDHRLDYPRLASL